MMRVAEWARAARKGRFLVLVLVLPIVACAPERPAAAPEIRVFDAMMTEPAGSAPAAAYLTITNEGEAPDTLIGAEIEAAGRVTLHTQALSDGMVRMEPLAFVELPAGGEVRLAPGGIHLMIEKPEAGLVAGDSLEITLLLRRKGRVPIEAEVVSYTSLGEAIGGAAPEHRHHDGGS